jgi:hypothetical protein
MPRRWACILIVSCLLAVATSASAQAPSVERVEALRLTASRVLSKYRSEKEKVYSQQSDVVFQHLKHQLDEIWGRLEQANLLHDELVVAYKNLTERADAAEAARRNEKKYADAARAREKVATQAVREREKAVRAKGWPPNVEKAVIERKIFVGMTSEQAVMAWGRPERVNQTTTASSVSEQWVYGSSYLYFQNGKLTVIQTSR